jgi:hypothetical protein
MIAAAPAGVHAGHSWMHASHSWMRRSPAHREEFDQRIERALLFRAQDRVEAFDRVGVMLELRLTFGRHFRHHLGPPVEPFWRGQRLLRSIHVLAPGHGLVPLGFYVGLEGLEGGFLIRPKVQDIAHEPRVPVSARLHPCTAVWGMCLRGACGRRWAILGEGAG